MSTRILAAGMIFALLLCHAALWPADATPLHVACIGDSITQGGYPRILGPLLEAAMATPVKVDDFGCSGSTLLKQGDLPYWQQPQYASATKSSPNAVVIMLGTNDSKPQNWVHKERYAAELTELVQVFARLPTKPAIWLVLPPPSGGNYGIRADIIKRELLPLIQQVAKAEKIGLIDVFNAFANHSEMLPDGVHPNAAGVDLLARTIAAGMSTKATKAK